MATTNQTLPVDPAQEIARARALAERYYHDFVDLKVARIDHDLFHSIPVDLMFRYNFVPLQMAGEALEIAMADPSRLMLIDEVSLLLDRRLVVRVTTLSDINDYLKKTQQSQRVLEEATEAFSLNVVDEEDTADEKLSIERLTKDSETSPVIRLVDTVLFSALERQIGRAHV